MRSQKRTRNGLFGRIGIGARRNCAAPSCRHRGRAAARHPHLHGWQTAARQHAIAASAAITRLALRCVESVASSISALRLSVAISEGASSEPEMLSENGTTISRNENRPNSAGGSACRKISEAMKCAPDVAIGPPAESRSAPARRRSARFARIDRGVERAGGARSCGHRAAAREDKIDRARIGDRIAPEQTARFARHAVKPFEPAFLHPARRARIIAGDEIEAAAAGDKPARFQPRACCARRRPVPAARPGPTHTTSASER